MFKQSAPVLSLLLVGCAYGLTRKVPHPAAYGYTPGSAEWRDMQKCADAIEGVRYYLPRPFVVVKREFPAASDTFWLRADFDKAGGFRIKGEVPSAHAGAFPKDSVLFDVRDARGNADAAGVRQQSERAAAATPADDAMIAIAKDAYVTGEVLDPVAVDARNRVVDFRVTLAKEPIDEGAQGTLVDGLWVVPWVGGKPDGSKAIEAVFVRRTVAAEGKPVLEGNLPASRLPAFYSLGVVVEKTVNGTKSRYLFHRSQASGSNQFAGTSDPKSSTSGNAGGAAAGGKPISSASLATMGDPATSPYTKVGDLFDIVLMPDFTEQYAMRIAGGFGYAKADLALENGWLAERVGMEVDNRELGILLADVARKLVDAGIAAASPTAAATDAAKQLPAANVMRMQSEGAAGEVLLRVDFVGYAVPGLHPLVKPNEAGGPPHIDYQIRKQYVVTLATPQGEVKEPDLGELKGVLEKFDFAKVSGRSIWKNGPNLRATAVEPAGLRVEYRQSDLVDGTNEAEIKDYWERLLKALRAARGDLFDGILGILGSPASGG